MFHNDGRETNNQDIRRLLVSQSRVVVRGGGHLQDALCIVLHQRAPLHLPCEQQVLPVQSVDVLHLHTAARMTHVTTVQVKALLCPLSISGVSSSAVKCLLWT